MNSALFDLESPVGEAVDAVALAALVAETATTPERQGLLIYAVYEADRKLAALKAEFDRLLNDRFLAANDNQAVRAA